MPDKLLEDWRKYFTVADLGISVYLFYQKKKIDR